MPPWATFILLFSKIVLSAPEDDFVTEYTDEFIERHARKEFFVGCYWTLRQIGEICDSHDFYEKGYLCRRSEVLAWDLQARLLDYYRPSRPGHQFARPPIEEVFWLLSTTEEDQFDTFLSCPGLLVTSLLMMAEIRLGTDGLVAAEYYANKAKEFVEELGRRSNSEENLSSMYAMFPVAEAWASYSSERERFVNERQPALRVDFVIAKCNHTLSWLRNVTIGSTWHLHIIDKCGGNFPMDFSLADLTDQLSFGKVFFNKYTTDEVDGFMTGECTAYLFYLLNARSDLPDLVVFLHDDAPRHLRLPFLNIVTKSILLGTFRGDFLHLNHERYLEMRTNCLAQAYQKIFGEGLKVDEFLSSYCCGQFVVSRNAMARRSVEFYENMNNLIREGWNGTDCGVGDMPCYIAEFVWHKVFTDKNILPLRSMDASLPLFLRYDHGRSTRLPSSIDFSLYHMSQSSWRDKVVGGLPVD